MERTVVVRPKGMRKIAFSYYSRLEKLDSYVKQHYAEPLPLAIAARIAGLERTYFSRFFHDKAGICYHDWLSWVRVSRATELMQQRDLPVTTTAFAVGFQDLRTFERACDKYTGLTPSQVKKLVRPC